MEVARHVLSTQSRKLVIFLQYIKKKVPQQFLCSIVMQNIQIFYGGSSHVRCYLLDDDISYIILHIIENRYHGDMFCKFYMDMILVSISLLLFLNPLDSQGIRFHLVWGPRFLGGDVLYFLHRWKQYLLKGYEKTLFVEADKSPHFWHEITARKMSKYRVFSGPYFPVFGLNTEIYRVNLCLHSKYGKIWTKKNFIFGHFLRSEIFHLLFQALYL